MNVPVDGQDDPWIGGRMYFEISAGVSEALGGIGGLSGGTSGAMKDRAGRLQEIHFHFFYEDLAAAVEAFRDQWSTIGFPDRTHLTHVERFPDCSFKHHVMIRWIDGEMVRYSTELTDDVLLTPTNG